MVKQALKDKPHAEQIAYIKAGVSVRYGTVVSVMDAMRAAGADRIGLVANKKNRPDVKPGTGELKRPVHNSAGSRDSTLSAAPALPLVRFFVTKSDGGQRPLSVPAVRESCRTTWVVGADDGCR